MVIIVYVAGLSAKDILGRESAGRDFTLIYLICNRRVELGVGGEKIKKCEWIGLSNQCSPIMWLDADRGTMHEIARLYLAIVIVTFAAFVVLVILFCSEVPGSQYDRDV